MNRLLALLLPLVCISAGGLRSGLPAQADSTQLAAAWAASLTAETNKDYDEALKQIAAFSEGGGDKYLATLRVGWLEYLKVNFLKSSEAYQRAAKLQPLAVAPLLGQMNAMSGARDYHKTTAAAEAVLRIEPTNYSAVMMLAGISLGGQDYRKAQTYYRRVLATYPGDLDATSGVAWASFYLGDKAEALRNFKIILMLKSEYPDAQKGADLCAKSGR